MLERRLGQRPGWLIAFSRLVLAIAILVLSTADPNDLSGDGLRYEFDDLSALAYVAFSGFALGLFMLDWWRAYRLRGLILVVDFAAYLMVMMLMEPMMSGFFAASIAMLTFLVLSVAVQWGWKQAAWVLLLLNLICVAVIVQMAWDGMSILHSMLLRRQTYQFLISFFLLWAASWVQSPKLAPLAMPFGLDPEAQFSWAIDYARAQLASSSAGLCWAGENEDGCAAMAGSSATVPCKAEGVCSSAFTETLRGPAIFDIRRSRCVAWINGGFARFQLGPDQTAFAAKFGIQSGIYIPLAGAAGRGRLVMEMPVLAGADMLRFAADVGQQISRSLDTQTYFRLLEENSTERVRQSIARDLHDNVAQTLAGTRFWLESLRSAARRGEPLDAKLGKLSDLLSLEQAHVAETIDLLLNSAQSARRDLTESLQILAKTLSMHWQADIQLSGPAGAIELPVDLVHELRAIAREAVSNAVRHGRASAVTMRVQATGESVTLDISNNGIPFKDRELVPRTIAERVSSCGGTLRLQSTTDKTCISVIVPIERS